MHVSRMTPCCSWNYEQCFSSINSLRIRIRNVVLKYEFYGSTICVSIIVSDTRKWDTQLEVKGQPPAPRSFHTATAVGKRIVVMGGRGVDNHHLADFHIFDTGTGQPRYILVTMGITESDCVIGEAML